MNTKAPANDPLDRQAAIRFLLEYPDLAPFFAGYFDDLATDEQAEALFYGLQICLAHRFIFGGSSGGVNRQN